MGVRASQGVGVCTGSGCVGRSRRGTNSGSLKERTGTLEGQAGSGPLEVVRLRSMDWL